MRWPGPRLHRPSFRSDGVLLISADPQLAGEGSEGGGHDPPSGSRLSDFLDCFEESGAGGRRQPVQQAVQYVNTGGLFIDIIFCIFTLIIWLFK